MRPGTIAVIGGGPAGLMAAEVAASGGAAVTIYDAMPSLGRKLLHGRARRPEPDAFRAASTASSADTAGSARRIAAGPRGLPARCAAGLGRRARRGDARRLERPRLSGRPGRRRRCCAPGCAASTSSACGSRSAIAGRAGPRRRPDVRDAGRAADRRSAGRDHPGARRRELAAARLGWRLGADPGGGRHRRSRRCGPPTSRSGSPGRDVFRERFAGEPLKRIARHVRTATRSRGEAVVTRTGIEGGAVYALSGPRSRRAGSRDGEAILHVDLRPDLAEAALEQALSRPRGKQSTSTWLRKVRRPFARRDRAAARRRGTLALPTEPHGLARLIKAMPLRIAGTAGFERAISTAGGVALSALDEHFMLRRAAGHLHRRRDAGLGRADGRVSAPGLFRDGGCGGTGSPKIKRFAVKRLIPAPKLIYPPRLELGI